MVANHLQIRIIILSIFLLLTYFVAKVSIVSADTVSTEITVIKYFEEYRKAVTSNSPDLAQYFSKEFNETLLADLNQNRSAEDQLATLGSVRATLSFSREICTVHHYEVIEGRDGDSVLKIYYSRTNNPVPILRELNYVVEDGRNYIARITRDTTNGAKVEGQAYADTVVNNFCD